MNSNKNPYNYVIEKVEYRQKKDLFGEEETERIKHFKLVATDDELNEISMVTLGQLLAIGIKGEDYKRAYEIYLRRKMNEEMEE